MNVRLYVHGTPQGNQTWGNVQGYDKQYIDSLYGGSIKKIEADVQMWVEVQENRDLGKKVCYYTYYRKDILEYGTARSGGYFAMTVRFDCYYSYVSNIYPLLDAVFNSFIVGQILDKKGGIFQYKVANLESHQAKKGYELGAIEEEIKKYLLTFSSNCNLLDLKDFNTSSNSQITKVNLCDYKPEEITSYMRQHGLVSISPSHPTAAVTNLKQELSNKEQLYRQKGQQEITELRNTIENKNQQIQSISNAKSTIEQEKLNVSAQLEKTNELIKKMRSLLSVGELHTAKRTNNNEEKAGDSNIQEKETLYQKLRKGIALINIILLPATFCLVLIMMLRSCTSESLDDKKNTTMLLEDSKTNEESDVSMTTGNETGSSYESSDDVASDKSDKQQDFLKYPTAKIDIAEINSRKPMKLHYFYTVNLTGVDDLQGDFISDDFYFVDNKITPKKRGDCTISYVIDGYKVLERTINVKD
ncbi:MAG: hypothetical protein NC206_10280 [Bacteroides sp.]|nr:hypothetical protein [Roseburia sp.]MCM1347454.1 hypothetical protein [Bacteroides sp.]MCM1421558.1 hypothetical protein [Bacteroides sp.]